MWRVYYRKHAAGALARASLLESLVRMSRRITLLLGIGAVLLFSLIAPPSPGEDGWQMLWITVAWSAVCVAAYWLAPRRLLAAHLVLVVAAAAGIPLAIAASQESLLVMLYTGLPMLSVALVGWPAGLAALLFSALAPSMLAAQGAAPPLPPSLAIMVAAVAAVAAALTWIVVSALLGLAESALLGLERAQVAVDEARSQRLEFRQVEEDLLQSTREQTRLLDRLKAMNQIAEEARQTKQEFIAKVSHELRTPLNMIIAYSELITQSPQLYGGRIPPALLADMAVILRNSQHLSKLVDDVLDLSQIDAGRMALSKVWTDVATIVREATEAVRPLFETKGLYLEIDVQRDLPLVYCDPTRIRQVLMNLLSNAGRFTTQGGVHVHVWGEGEQMRFSVWDSGPGIDPRDRAHLFEPFQQIDASIRRKHGGSGLGLNISKQFVEMHEGQIWLESQPGEGTVFHVSLPLSVAAPLEVEPLAVKRWINPYNVYTPRTRSRVAPIPEVTPRYVVLDYGRILERLLSRYLQNAEVVHVQTVEEAMQVLNESPARALVVHSALLPRASWSDGGLGKLPFDTPMIACWLPSDAAPEHLGVTRYLVKPVSRETLQAAVRGLGPQVRTVLVCDDEPDVLRLFLRILSGLPEGYRIITATNGVEGLAALRELHPDAVVLDLLMPEMTGFELLRAKEADPDLRDIPVLAVSSLDPYQQPIVSNQLVVTRGSGLSSRDLLQCIESLSAVLAPDPPTVHPAQTATPVG
jgi:signal transduction histidine kinase/CheY-like chemotaxis protein